MFIVYVHVLFKLGVLLQAGGGGCVFMFRVTGQSVIGCMCLLCYGQVPIFYCIIMKISS